MHNENIAPSVHNERLAHIASVRSADYARAKENDPQAVVAYEQRANAQRTK